MKKFTILLFFFFFLVLQSKGQPGTLDNSFGNNGKVITEGFATCYTAGFQLNGKIILAGSGNAGFLLKCYQKDGQIDSSFGVDGTAVADLGMYDEVSAIAIQTDGKIVAAGYSYTDFFYDETGDWFYNMNFALSRFLADGKIDSSFGENGKVITDFNSFEWGYAVLIQPDGKILMGGTIAAPPPFDRPQNFLLVRYLPDGTLDSDFGLGGKVETDINSISNDVLRTLILQPNGNIIAAGSTTNLTVGNSGKFAVIRYLPDGSLDASFGNEGTVITDFGNKDDEITDILLQPDGKIVATGFTKVGSLNITTVLIRYNINGSIDTEFGTSGKVKIEFEEGNSRGQSVSLQPNGKILIGGEVIIGGVEDFVLARCSSNGNMDSTFGTNGKVTTDFGGDDYKPTCLLNADGKIILAGNTFSNHINNFALARYNGDPTHPLISKIKHWIKNHILNFQDNNLEAAYYIIEQSSNGVRDFKEAARIEAVSFKLRATSKTTGLYNYAIPPTRNQKRLAESRGETIFYRIKTVNKDGSYNYSDIITDNGSTNQQITKSTAQQITKSTTQIFPNPVKDKINIQSAMEINIRLQNSLGQIILTQKIKGNGSIDVSKLTAGLYYIIDVESGESFKVVKE